MRRQEGWVQLSFVVGADGTVQSPVVEDSSGVPAFEKAALSAIQRTRYQPATWQGKPIEQCATQFRYVFLINSPRLGARESFIHEFKEVNRLTTEQKMDEAEEKLLAMTEKGTWSNYESARLWLMRAGIQQKKGDQAGELRSLERATMVGGRFLEPELYRAALQEKFRLQAKLMKFRDALDTYDRIKALKPPIDNASIEKAAGDIQAAIQSPDLLSFPGVVEYRSGCEEGRANWKHELLRRKFAFDAVEGNVEDFQLRCDWKLVSDKFSVEKTWQVPASWGYCQVFVFGDVGAKFKLLEYPQQADASP